MKEHQIKLHIWVQRVYLGWYCCVLQLPLSYQICAFYQFCYIVVFDGRKEDHNRRREKETWCNERTERQKDRKWIERQRRDNFCFGWKFIISSQCEGRSVVLMIYVNINQKVNMNWSLMICVNINKNLIIENIIPMTLMICVNIIDPYTNNSLEKTWLHIICVNIWQTLN